MMPAFQIYLPAEFDKTQPAFRVFQDGVIYKAPVVHGNLIDELLPAIKAVVPVADSSAAHER